MGERKLPTHAEQMATYELRKAEYDRAYSLWAQNGRQGPPPPRPVMPHTPGWRQG